MREVGRGERGRQMVTVAGDGAGAEGGIESTAQEGGGGAFCDVRSAVCCCL